MQPITASQLVQILRDNGFVLSRQRGSHMIWKQMDTSIIVPVPLHGKSKPLPIGTLISIIKQSKIPREKFVSKK